MDHSKRCAPITMQSNQVARPTRRCDMDVQARGSHPPEPALSARHRREDAGLPHRWDCHRHRRGAWPRSQSAGDHFICHIDPTIILRSTDPVVLAYLTVKGFEDWCMDQLADSYTNSEEEPRG